MGFISEEEYNAELQKIKEVNESKERKQKLKAERNKYSRKVKTSNKVLASSIVAVILFTIACLYIQYTTSMEVSSTLITLWYSFWTVEIVSLAGIKISKVFKENKASINEEESPI